MISESDSPILPATAHTLVDTDDREGPAAGSWAAVLSLGSSCAIAYHLHRKGLAKRTGPLDWLGSRNGESVAHMIRSRFNSLFMNRRVVKVVGDHNRYWKVNDAVNNVFTLHDFPIVGRKPKPLWKPPLGERVRRVGDRCREPVWRWLPWLRFDGPDSTRIPLPGYPEFRRRVARRVARYVSTLENPAPVLVIRRARDTKEAEMLLSALLEIRGGAPTRLLVLGFEDIYAQDWGIPNLRTAMMPPDDPTTAERWRGRDEDWDRLFEGCALLDS